MTHFNRSSRSGRLVRAIAAGLSASLLCLPAQARADCRSPARIVFGPGATQSTVSGGLVRDEDACYRLTARAGQEIRVSIRSPDDNVVFALYGPGWRVGPGSGDGPDIAGATVPNASDRDGGTSLRTVLPRTGSYLLDLGLLRGGGGEYAMTVLVR